MRNFDPERKKKKNHPKLLSLSRLCTNDHTLRPLASEARDENQYASFNDN